jgi:hypothetical protein
MRGLTVVFATSPAKSSASILVAVDYVLSHALHVPTRSVLLAALTVSVVCLVEHLVIGFHALSAVRAFLNVIINVPASAVHLVLKLLSVKNVPMRTPSLVWWT